MSINFPHGPLVQIQSGSAATATVPPRHTDLHLFETELGNHLLLVNGSRVFTISPEIAAALAARQDETESLLAQFGLAVPEYITDEPLTDVPIRSLSLAIAQKCNLGCTYCYAQEGGFGTKEKDMSPEAARDAIDLLLSEVKVGDSVQLAFLGGEPLTNRKLLRECTERAAALAEAKHVRIGFSITTNGTLITPEDGTFFELHSFAVTISLDGVGKVNDNLRSFKNGRGSYERVLASYSASER